MVTTTVARQPRNFATRAAHHHIGGPGNVAMRRGRPRGGELHIERAEWVTTDRTVTDGDQIHLWLNDAGAQVDPPTPLTQAGVDAIGAGAGIGGCAILGLIAGVALVRSRLDRIRRARLEREIDRFASGDTTNHSQ